MLLKEKRDMTTTVIPATPADYNAVVALLQSSQLPTADIEKSLPHFFVVKQAATIIAVIGLECFNNVGLLRSMATADNHRSKGIAGNLITALESYAASKKITTIYLLTTTASEYFKKKGYILTDRFSVPQSIQQTKEFSGLCPSSAAVMKKKL
jgi:amino-acid N-acetyltransferase